MKRLIVLLSLLLTQAFAAPAPSPGFPVCYICGSKTKTVGSTYLSKSITLGGVTTTCLKLQYGGLHGFIQAAYCPTLSVFKVPKKCGCTGSAPVKAPVKAPAKAPVKAPAKAPVKAPVKKPVKAPVKKPVKAPVKKPVKAPVKTPVKSPVKAPVKKPT